MVVSFVSIMATFARRVVGTANPPGVGGDILTGFVDDLLVSANGGGAARTMNLLALRGVMRPPR